MTLLLVEGVYWFLQDSPLENSSQYPPSLQPLIASQEDIGWDQFFLGRLSSLWSSTHLSSLNQRNLMVTKFNSGIHWSSSLIRTVWSHVHQLWLTRNGVRHGKTFSEQLEKQRQHCISELSVYCEYHSKGLLTHNFPQHVFYSNIQEHLHHESTLSDLDNWLSTHRDLILDNKQRQSLTQAPPVGASLDGLNRSSGVGITLE